METQGWPLWAVRKSTGELYAVIGWDGFQPIGVRLGQVVAPKAEWLKGELTFTTDPGSAQRILP